MDTLESSIVRGPSHPDDGAVPGVLKTIVGHLAEVAVDFAGEGGHWVGSLVWYALIVRHQSGGWGERVPLASLAHPGVP